MIIYPAERYYYAQKVGRLRVENIAAILEDDFGFVVETKEPQANDVDIKIYTNSKLICVAEVVNWNRLTSHLSIERKDTIIGNLTNYNAHRLFICSFLENLNFESYSREIQAHNIKIITLGFQTMYDNWYDYFKDKYPEHAKYMLPFSDPKIDSTIQQKLSYLKKYK